MPTKKTLKITFTKSPTGRYGLAYSDGETAELPQPQAEQIIEDGYALLVKSKATKPKASK